MQKTHSTGVAILGASHWGKNLVRICSALGHPLTVVDPNPVIRRAMAKAYPSIRVCSDSDGLWADTAIQAVFIATPSSTHFTLAKRAIESGKHVFIEKPITQSYKEAAILARLAKHSHTTVMVDHTYCFSTALTQAKRLIQKGAIGRITGIDSTRIGPGIIRADGSVLWDLAPHDISIGMYLTGLVPHHESVLSVFSTRKTGENAVLGLHYGRIPMRITISWISPIKLRLLTIYGTKGSLALQWNGANETCALYPLTSPDGNPFLHGKHIVLPPSEPLYEAVSHFFDCIRTGNTPITDTRHAKDVVGVLERLQTLMGSGRQ